MDEIELYGIQFKARIVILVSTNELPATDTYEQYMGFYSHNSDG